MNIKLGLVAGAAVACVVMSGCKAPKAQVSEKPVRVAPSTTVPPAKPEVAPAPIVAPAPVIAPAPAPAPAPVRCKCAPGTVHTSPCACGADNCKCKVKPAEPAYTLYRIKGGDMLSSICATYGLKQSKVLELNPGLDPNKLFVGKKIKLPGTIELKDADKKSLDKKAVAPAKKASKAATSGKVSSYKGATKEYVVVTFLAILEMARQNELIIKQDSNFGEITCEGI